MGIKGKIVSVISFICLTVCLFMVGVWALTETDFNVSGDIEYTAPVTADDVGTYSTLKFFVNDDGENTVSVMANPDNKPTGSLVIPAHVSSGGTVYTVTRIEYSTAETLSTQEVSVTPRLDGPSAPGGPPEEEVLGAFQGCSSLTSVTIPDSVKTIGSLAFSACNLTETNYLGDINDWVQIEFVDTFSNPTTISSSLKINGVEVTSVVINTSTTINYCVFQNLNKLTSVTIGNQVTSIGAFAFYNCSGLTSIIIPDSVTSIGFDAFDGCSSLETVTMKGATPPTLSASNVFNNTPSSLVIYVPTTAAQTAYQSATYWSDYSSKIKVGP